MPSASTAEDLARMGGPPSPNAESVLSHITFDGDTSTETEAPVEETSTEEERTDTRASRDRVLLSTSPRERGQTDRFSASVRKRRLYV